MSKCQVVAISLLAVAVTGCNATSNGVTTTPNSSHSSSASATAKSSGSSKPSEAHLGQSITLTGESAGEKIAVTPTKVVNSATGGDEFTKPDKGKRFYAVQFRIKDLGAASYNDSPTNGAVAIDSKGQQYQADIADNITAGSTFGGSVKVTTGQKALGYIVFQVPKRAKITEIQFSENSGFGKTGQWHV